MIVSTCISREVGIGFGLHEGMAAPFKGGRKEKELQMARKHRKTRRAKKT